MAENALDIAESPTPFALAASNPMLGQLTRPALKALVDRGVLVEIGPDDHLVRQGAPSDAAYLLICGEVEILVETAYGSVQLARLTAGTLVGEVGIFADIPRTASVIARGAVHAMRFARADILAAGAESPEFLRSVMGKLGQQLSTYNSALGFYTNALTALEQRNFDLRLLDDLMQPTPELANFGHTFRRIAEQIMLRQAHDREMASAAAIQRAILPDPELTTGRISNLDIHTFMRPAKEVGGDLYDVFLIDADTIAITIGDVSGKGVPASLFMAVTQSVIRLALRHGGDLSEQIRAANDLLVSYNRETMFVTLFCGVIDLSTGVLTYCNCGHNAPLLLRKTQDDFEKLKSTGPPLALTQDTLYSTRELMLAPDDCLVMFTDGITEATNSQDVQYGNERLEQTIRSWRALPPADLVNQIIASASDFAADAPQYDDMTCLAIVYRARVDEAPAAPLATE